MKALADAKSGRGQYFFNIASFPIYASPRAFTKRKGAKKTKTQVIENPKIVPPGKYDNQYFFGQVLSKIEYEVVDPKLVKIIRSLQSRDIKTIAFTRMPIGSLRIIPSMEDWRIEHLKKHQFDFSKAFPQFEEIKVSVLSTGIPSLFKKGVLCVNKQDKGPVLISFLEIIQWKPE